MRGLAQWLSSQGVAVDLLITDLKLRAEDIDSEATDFVDNVYFLAEFAQADKTIHSQADKAIHAPVDEPSKSYAAYRFLRGRGYDEVHFNDWLGAGFYAAMARRQGLFDAAVVTHLHGDSRWVRLHNLHAPNLNELEVEAMERSQIENSDLVISPSQYLIGWGRSQGLALPQAIQRNWILPQWADPGYAGATEPLRTRAVPPGTIDELVFFGRHERRKGFEAFVEAVARLPDGLTPDITFMGRFDQIAREHTVGLALRRLRNYPGRLRFLNDFRQSEAIDFLKRSRRRLAVMPSLIENSPCVVGECFTASVPFLASDVGGTSELVAPESRALCLVSPDADALATALRRVLEQGLPELVSTLTPGAIRESWRAAATARPAPKPDRQPLVSVCVTHYERPHLLRRAYEALQQQTYPHIEIVIVDDGSRTAGAHAYLDEIEATPARFPVKVVRGPNRYLGAARNAGARLAQGEYLLFHDDDNFAEPNEVETFVAAALASDADVLTAQCYVFHDGEQGSEGLKRRIEFYPLGVGGVFSFFRNRFGDANALMRRTTFEELGGFSEARGVGFEDWELFLKAFMAGKRMGLVPEPLFNYRASATGMLGSGDPLRDHERIFSAMDAAHPRLGADMLRYATREHLGGVVLERTWARLAREREGDAHQQLIALEPNSPEAIAKLRDLALQMGRLTEAVEIGARVETGREALAALLNERPGARWKARAPHIVVLEPEKSQQVAFLEGWAIDGAGVALDLAAIWAGGRWLSVAGARRFRRPDVKALFHLGADADLGFRLLAIANGGALSPQAQGFFGRPLGKNRTEGLRPMHRAAFQIDDFECNLPAGPGWRGHVDRGGWYRAVKLAPPQSLTAGATIDVETSVPSEPAILWADGTLDFGVKLAGNRARFTREATGETDFTVLSPTRVRTHVIVA